MSILTSRKTLTVLSVVALYCSVLTGIYMNFPEMKPEEKQHFKYPRSLDDAKRLGKVLSRYKDQHFYTVLCGVVAVYIVLQSFAIPGSIFLTILSGYLFPFPVALALVCMCSALGAAVCYYLSHSVGRKLMTKFFPDRLLKWQAEIQSQRENLFNYIVFLRVTPILPNWFINIASPLLDVPLKPFFFGTLAGVAPPSFLFIQAGTTLQMMTTTNAMWSWSSTGMLGFFAVLSLLPVVYKHYKLKTD
ncbi:SNARE associated golgi protein domain-containing protein [Ditylenchus destructor]|uniref:SNARE associated golgi protein domain-containing protein n=1 Tax=Ditylenchus destructor TaxID=166010 RepID=A0AAD4QXF8_9BILA|nr:SNARE associated golgi protein domain-containing protein [Ditylenchus destructor]